MIRSDSIFATITPNRGDVYITCPVAFEVLDQVIQPGDGDPRDAAFTADLLRCRLRSEAALLPVQRDRHANRLPEFCKRQIRTSRGLRTVYGARCLARDGWQVTSRWEN